MKPTPLPSPFRSATITPEQKAGLAKIFLLMEKVNFSQDKLTSSPLKQEISQLLESICTDVDDQIRIRDFIEALVYWNYLCGYWLIYFLQTLPLKIQTNIGLFSQFCLSQAQMNFNQDHAYISIETAYHNFRNIKKNTPDIDKNNEIEIKLKNHITFFHSKWRKLCRPLEPEKINPLVENFYTYSTHQLLKEQFPNLDFKNDYENSLLSIIDQCYSEDFNIPDAVSLHNGIYLIIR